METIDRWLVSANNALRTLSGAVHAARPLPSAGVQDELPDAERSRAGALMRVNHVGEVCAQALYQAQTLTARDPALRERMQEAAREELDHLAWTRERLRELGDRPSRLNPLWYAGSFAIGMLAGRLGDARSLGFVIETERQVEQHLSGHLEQLLPADARSRAIVEQMRNDERRHAQNAVGAGGQALPRAARWLMRGAAKLMTTVAARV